MELEKNPQECAFHIKTNDNVCVEDDVINILHNFAKIVKNIKNIFSKKDTIDKLMIVANFYICPFWTYHPFQ